MSNIELLTSDKAITCHRQVHGEMGGATVHCVVLADGFIVDCGSDGYALGRARFLAMAVNEFGPNLFTKEGIEVATKEALNAE